MRPMPTPPDSASDEIVRRLAAAKEALLERMRQAGCAPEDGWKVYEEIRGRARGGTVWVMRAVHVRLEPPDGLEAVVEIDASGNAV